MIGVIIQNNKLIFCCIYEYHDTDPEKRKNMVTK